MEILKFLGEVLLYLLLPSLVIAFLAGRLLGARRSFLTTLIVSVAGLGVGSLIALGASDFDSEAVDRELSVADVFVVSLIVTMVLLTGLELLQRSGNREPSGWIRRFRRVSRRVAALRRSLQVLRIARRNGLGATSWLPGRRKRLAGTVPERLRRTLEESGGTMVKLGQVASTREDVLPPDYARELSKLRSRVEPAPRADIEEVIVEELGRPLEEVFVDFDWDPLGSASIAQVHRARLLTGEDVVVKVQRPAVADTIQRDVRALRELARFVDQRSSSGVGSRLGTFVTEFGANLIEELDFRIEAANAADMAAVMRPEDRMHVPDVHDELTSTRLMVQERVIGVPVGTIDDLDGTVDRADVAARVFRSFFHDALEIGVFHADPHPGNLLVDRTGTVYLIDFGAVGRLDPALLDGLRRMLVAAGLGDPDGLTDAVSDVVGGIDPDLESGLHRALSRFLARHTSRGGVGPEALAEILRVIGDFGLDVPGELSLLGRALVTIDGTLRVIDPEFRMTAAAAEMAREWADEMTTDADMDELLRDEVIRNLPALRRLPRDLQRTLAASTSSGVALRVSWLQHPTDRAALSGYVNRLVVAVVAPLLAIASVMLLDVQGGEIANDVSYYDLLAGAGLFGASILALRLVIVVAREGFALSEG